MTIKAYSSSKEGGFRTVSPGAIILETSRQSSVAKTTTLNLLL